MGIYKEIRKMRLEGMSQRQIAVTLHISRNTVKKYWNGDSVPWGVSDKFPALFNSTKKQRLLRCSALPYTKYGPLFRALYSLTFLSTLVLPDTP